MMIRKKRTVNEFLLAQYTLTYIPDNKPPKFLAKLEHTPCRIGDNTIFLRAILQTSIAFPAVNKGLSFGARFQLSQIYFATNIC